MINKNEKEVQKPIYVTSTKNNVIVECSFEWNAGYLKKFTIYKQYTSKRQNYLLVLSALTRVINKYSNDRNNKKNKITYQ